MILKSLSEQIQDAKEKDAIHGTLIGLGIAYFIIGVVYLVIK